MQIQGAFTPGGAHSQDVVEADEPAVPARSADAPGLEAPAARALAKPPVRKLAKDLGVDLSSLSGTGPKGSITREDVESARTGTDVTSVEPVESLSAADRQVSTSTRGGPGVRERRERVRYG